LHTMLTLLSNPLLIEAPYQQDMEYGHTVPRTIPGFRFCLTFKALSVLLSGTLARRERGEGHDRERCGAGSGVRKEQVERNRARCMGIQSAVLVHGRCGEPITMLPETVDYGEREWVECEWTNLGRPSAERQRQTEVRRDKAVASPVMAASHRQGACEWTGHDESIPSIGCGSTHSMMIIEPIWH
jgi:hypothetical protein